MLCPLQNVNQDDDRQQNRDRSVNPQPCFRLGFSVRSKGPESHLQKHCTGRQDARQTESFVEELNHKMDQNKRNGGNAEPPVVFNKELDQFQVERKELRVLHQLGSESFQSKFEDEIEDCKAVKEYDRQAGQFTEIFHRIPPLSMNRL